jgi:hypothetical protein
MISTLQPSPASVRYKTPVKPVPVQRLREISGYGTGFRDEDSDSR